VTVIRYSLKTQYCSPTTVSKFFDGFELVKGAGYWQGKREDCVSVNIIGTDADLDKVLALARTIREQYRQEEVWITSETVNLRRVTIDAVKGGLET
jgi:hypothetical protein